MGRRSRPTINRNIDGQRSSIGDTYVEDACKALDRAAQIEANIFVTDAFTPEQVISMIIPDDIVQRAKDAFGIVRPAYGEREYNCWAEMSVTVAHQHNEATRLLPIEPEHMRIYNDRFAPLHEAAATINAIWLKYQEVRWLLRWFNRNATPGAVRNYWPSVLTLCPKSPSIEAEGPSRYSTPNGIGQLLPLIRSTSTTVATMQMLPSDAEPRPRSTVRLTCKGHSLTTQGHTIGTDGLSFHL